MIEVTSIFTRLDQEFVYETSVEQSKIDEILCDKT